MKKIAVEVLTTKWCQLLRIVEQTHREKEFGENSDTFIAKNGFKLSSIHHPEIGYNALFVLGSNSAKDDEIVIVPDEEYLPKLRRAIREYNERFSGGEPTENDRDIERIE